MDSGWLPTFAAVDRAHFLPPGDVAGRSRGRGRPRQQVRELWTEIEAALAWWTAEGRPEMDCFGLTVDADGTHTTWLDEPHHTLPSTG